MGRLFGQAIYRCEITPSILVELLDEVVEQKAVAVFILCCDASFEHNSDFDEILIRQKIKIFGGIFPNILVNEDIKDKGVLVVPVFEDIEVTIFSKLSQLESSDYQPAFNINNADSFMVLVDGFASHIDLALTQLLHQLGDESTFFGGGVGSLSLQQKPCLFTNQGVLVDAMTIISLKQPWRLAVGHGWDVFAGPFLVTKVHGNRIEQLNFQPASDIYRQATGLMGVDDADIFSVISSYPFGLERLDDDYLVRSVIAMTDSSLTCLNSIAENTLVYILKGDTKSLVDAAVASVEKKVAQQNLDIAILFDCVSRHHFLQDQFGDELTGIKEGIGADTVLFGALVFGEIASGSCGNIHFYNKTAVTAFLQNEGE